MSNFFANSFHIRSLRKRRGTFAMAREVGAWEVLVQFSRCVSGSYCGYCGGDTGKWSSGMWAHALTVHDYQDLIDRGWRRSGEYLYKPIMDKTCCPQYTIRCQVLDYRLSKSQKKILKRMTMYLTNGDILPTEVPMDEHPSACHVPHPVEKPCQLDTVIVGEVDQSDGALPKISGSSSEERAKRPPKPGVGADPSRPMARKAKDLRRERRMLKQQKQDGMESGDQASGSSQPESSSAQRLSASPAPFPSDGLASDAGALSNVEKGMRLAGLSHRQAGQHPEQQAPNQPKTLEDFVTKHKARDGKHKLEVRLVRSSPPSSEFLASFQVSYLLYKRYQVVVHKDPPSKPSQEQFKRFLCNSPFKDEYATDGPDVGYGSFHQQYWVDGRLIAVGVLDILPRCLSSVYLYYDPDFAFLSMGIYSALREVAFTRQLYTQAPALRYYYMGFYIHSCPKMRYKAQYGPADLLCPETYSWVSAPQCLPKLDVNKYSRLNADASAVDENHPGDDLARLLVLYNMHPMLYGRYQRLGGEAGRDDDGEVREFAGLVGRACAQRMLLYRH
ncbi:arginyl-tRNA--protein transferase 1 isoform X1 [Lethenteron reissneri]|uniref:arginyl-tRNA--protein transferase 1 isoform X1 n=1 Tax=Lethenteron reissneri TaxID=7753 RepID=UPI002AB70FE2|nr:arginyl-tRNA--protein transferase 1 isoform X1 [Lethenteron reissneri]